MRSGYNGHGDPNPVPYALIGAPVPVDAFQISDRSVYGVPARDPLPTVPDLAVFLGELGPILAAVRPGILYNSTLPVARHFPSSPPPQKMTSTVYNQPGARGRLEKERPLGS
ncbi:hypothetical protein CMQ_8278 [Grosmannia clavigera kw1407]|uniref:Uncharacterized protein n=1 Tax=Grosmannia clavigera (strain kw1407 / UAMH 11150) TaxID=655863 RepID=F0XKR6_GROCL|nr:uncharacterized protein CMQ_8278 [Grosmannia clavigera kw1407]EFX01812.1 hypothetical protein CMQ_8278 [Grosmannia clavigera kw1407]